MSLLQIRLPGEPRPEESSGHPADALLACHVRIREFTELSARLAAAGGDPDSVSRTAGRVARYFAEALPLHEADEDLSIAPRLRLAGASEELLQALDVVARQHPDIDRVVARMLTLWRALEADPAQLPTLAESLARSTARLSELWGPHLALEETTILPALRALAPEDVAAIRAEMRERRRASSPSS